MARRRWTDDDVSRMIDMRERQCLSWSVIDAELKRPAGGSCIKYESLRRPKLPSMHPNDAGGRITLSVDQEMERTARRQASLQRDLTAEIFGDPPPGFSALDKRCAGIDPLQAGKAAT